MFANGSNIPNVSARHTVAVYDHTNGEIVHMHQVVVLEGGKMISEQEAEKEAMQEAKSRGHDTSKLKTLLDHDHAESPSGAFRVDLARKKLVGLEIPARRQPQPK